MVTNMALSKGENKMPKTEDGGFILDDSGMCPYSINEKPEKEKENKVIPHVEEVSLFEKEYSYNGTNRKPEVVLRDKDDRIIPTECYRLLIREKVRSRV